VNQPYTVQQQFASQTRRLRPRPPTCLTMGKRQRQSATATPRKRQSLLPSPVVIGRPPVPNPDNISAKRTLGGSYLELSNALAIARGQEPEPVPPGFTDSSTSFIPMEVVSRRFTFGIEQYEVSFSPPFDHPSLRSFEPLAHLEGLEHLVEEFLKAHQANQERLAAEALKKKADAKIDKQRKANFRGGRHSGAGTSTRPRATVADDESAANGATGEWNTPLPSSVLLTAGAFKRRGPLWR